MRKCLDCDTEIDGDSWQCETCGWKPLIKDGILIFAPELVFDNEGFNENSFTVLETLEDGNFWFEARNHVIVHLLKRFFKPGSSYLEIGCGTGFVLRSVANSDCSFVCSGSEIHLAGLKIAEKRFQQDINLYQLDARRLPFIEEYDVIGSYDCIEHIDEDETTLMQMFSAVKSGGGVVITVPQHPSLWSQTDEVAQHKRRYTRNDLQKKLESAGFKVQRTTSFMFFLFPLMWSVRVFRKFLPKKEVTNFSGDGLRINPILNYLLTLIMRVEVWLIKAGVDLPFGGSLMIVARKGDTD